MNPNLALLHVLLPFLLCVALANTGLFDDVAVDLSYAHYAERRVEHLPAFLAMPCNCLVNLAYIAMGLYWLLRRRGGEEAEQSRYMRQVFAFMALLYAPWFTLPIFAWVPIWISVIERQSAKRRAPRAAALEACSLLSYGLALAHERGFELALGCHVGLAVYRAVRVQRAHGDGRTRAYLQLAVLSCAGFVALKLLDHWLARYRLFQRFTGHFWSKVCDVLQFHFSFCFLTELTHGTQSGYHP
uniref:Transmembrane protein 187 n=1 Tax=Scophthalmus maximus TaxID=52904 RepID=A0A8D3DX40_SCOMX